MITIEELDIVYKFKTNLESRLLSKSAHGTIHEGWARLPVISGSYDSLTISNLSFFYRGRSVSGLDSDSDQRLFHVSISKNIPITFSASSRSECCLNLDTYAIGFYYPYNPEGVIEINETLENPFFYTISESKLASLDNPYAGTGVFPGLILLKVWHHNGKWNGIIDGTAWSERLYNSMGITSAPRLSHVSIPNDNYSLYSDKKFVIKKYNEKVDSLYVLATNLNTKKMEALIIDVSAGVTLPVNSGEIGTKYFAVGYNNVFNNPSEVVLTCLSPQGGRNSLAQAISDGEDFTGEISKTLVGVIEWSPYHSKIINTSGVNNSFSFNRPIGSSAGCIPVLGGNVGNTVNRLMVTTSDERITPFLDNVGNNNLPVYVEGGIIKSFTKPELLNAVTPLPLANGGSGVVINDSNKGAYYKNENTTETEVGTLPVVYGGTGNTAGAANTVRNPADGVLETSANNIFTHLVSSLSTLSHNYFSTDSTPGENVVSGSPFGNTPVNQSWHVLTFKDSSNARVAQLAIQNFNVRPSEMYIRTKHDVNWSAWKKILDSADIIPVNKGGTGADNAQDAKINLMATSYGLNPANLNSLDASAPISGIYVISEGSVLNLPTPGGLRYYHVIQMRHGDNNGYNSQIAVSFYDTSRGIYFRSSNGSVWSDWAKLSVDGHLHEDLVIKFNGVLQSIYNGSEEKICDITLDAINAEPARTKATDELIWACSGEVFGWSPSAIESAINYHAPVRGGRGYLGYWTNLTGSYSGVVVGSRGGSAFVAGFLDVINPLFTSSDFASYGSSGALGNTYTYIMTSRR